MQSSFCPIKRSNILNLSLLILGPEAIPSPKVSSFNIFYSKIAVIVILMPTQQNINICMLQKSFFFFQNSSIIIVFVVVVAVVVALVVVACLFWFVLLGILIAWHLLKINRTNGSEN